MKTRVLLVDDCDHQHEIYRCYASLHDNIILDHAVTIEMAVASIHKNKPDLILLDNILGWDQSYLASLSAIDATGFTGKIVLLTCDPSLVSITRARKFGVDFCMDKQDINLRNFGDFLETHVQKKLAA